MSSRSAEGVCALLVLLVMAFAAKAEAQLLSNGGFETGDFSHWTVTIPIGLSEFGGPQPAGTAEITASWGPRGAMSGGISPYGGIFFAALGSSDFAFFTDPVAIYHITSCRSLSLQGGDAVSGRSLFYNGDNQPQETASVRILDDLGQLVSILWSDTSGTVSPGGVPYQNASAWSFWQWQAPADGDYTLELGITTQGDDSLASFGLFDEIEVVSAPEPVTVVLFGGGLGALLVSGRRFRR